MDWDHLPHNVKLCILLYLDYKSILRMTAVSKGWLGLVPLNQQFWRQKFELDFGEWEGGDVDFKKEYKLEYGLRFRDPRVVDLEGHARWVTGVKLHGSMLVSRCSGNVVKLWDLESMECVYVITELKRILSTALEREKLFLGLYDGFIHIWSLPSKRCHTWRAHATAVWNIVVSNDRLITRDNSLLKIWHMATFECLRSFQTQLGIGEMHVVGGEVLLGYADEKQVDVFHQEDGLVYTMDIGKRVFVLCANSKHVFVGCGISHIQVWERETREKVATVDVPPIILGIWCDERKLIFGTGDGHISTWDAKTLKNITHTEFDIVNAACFAYGKGRIVIGYLSGKITVLSFAL